MALAVGCGPTNSGDTGAAATGDTGEQATVGATEVVTETESADDVDTTAAPPEPGLARGGIEVDWVQANQGVGVAIGADGGEVGPSGRAAPLIQNRLTLIRAFWTVPDDWVPREIEGRLIVTWPDGAEETAVDSKVIEADAFEGDLGRSFFWGLMADQVVPGLQYRVELYETSLDHEDIPMGGTPPTLPVAEDTTAFVGIEDSYQVLKVVVVPFNYNDGGDCVTTPDTSEETMQLFQDLMYMQNPLERLDFTLHEPIDWNEPLTGFFQLNSFMAGLRFDEGAPPETYYYGLVDVCDTDLGGAGGQAIDIPSDPVNPDSASGRVSSGLSLGADWSAETFVHEVGHSQGRRHVTCNGEEGGPNPSYPHEGGDVGEWGFGVIDFGLRHPTFYKDYMTYCHPTWVGTWGWNRVYPVIRGLSEWDEGGGPVAPPEGGTHAAPASDPYSGSMLLGTIGPNGEEEWITVPGRPTAELDSSVRFQFRAGSRLVAEQAAYVHEFPEGGGTVVMVPLPDAWSEVTAISRADGTTHGTVLKEAVVEHHQKRLIQR